MEYININANWFLFDDNSDHICYGKIIGKIEKLATPYINRKGEKCHHELPFIKNECEKALNRGGLEGMSIIMKKFKTMELLNYEKDRNTRKRKLFNEG